MVSRSGDVLIDNNRSILDILERCLSSVRAKWRDKALIFRRKEGAFPAFEAFVTFMDETVSNACDPTYGWLKAKSNPQTSWKVN